MAFLFNIQKSSSFIDERFILGGRPCIILPVACLTEFVPNNDQLQVHRKIFTPTGQLAKKRFSIDLSDQPARRRDRDPFLELIWRRSKILPNSIGSHDKDRMGISRSEPKVYRGLTR